MEEESARRREGKFDLIPEVDWFDGFGAFDGIICHLGKEYGGNVHVKGVVNITASSNNRNQCHRVTDSGWNDYWETYGGWLCFDFKEKTASLTKYSLKPGRYWHLRQ